MNWIIFTTECSGKTTFCRNQDSKLGEFTLVDYDKLMYFNTDKFSNELHFIILLNELSKNDNQLCFTNILPPDFILGLNEPYINCRFAILLLEKEELKHNIAKRHHELYDTSYIIEQYEKLKEISERDTTSLKTFKKFKDISYQFYPEIRKVLNIKPKNIIRL